MHSTLYKANMHTTASAPAPSSTPFTAPTAPHALAPLQGVHILSLALNLPGPAALLRCQQMGAHCSKLEPLAPDGHASADPMHTYSPSAYAQLHEGIALLHANLKTEPGQDLLHAQLAHTDVLLTSFRPQALEKLGLGWSTLHARYPRLNMVRIWGSTAPNAGDHAGHDLTYQTDAGLVHDGHLPASLFADMAGAVMASEAVLQTLLARASSGHGHCVDIGLAQAAHWLALPRQWQMTTPNGDVGGAHAGYRMYQCQDGWVALAALEPHFAQRICHLVGLHGHSGSVAEMRTAAVHTAIEAWMLTQTCAQISTMATQSDIPLQPIPIAYK